MVRRASDKNNKIFTDDLGCEWFQYVGSNIATTREFCEHLTTKEYIHKSEIPKILQGEIDDHQCEIYEKTGLPKGLIDGTTAENFQVNVGGWNCRHQLVPIAKEAVPKEIRAKFERTKQETKEQQKTERNTFQCPKTGRTNAENDKGKWEKYAYKRDVRQ